MHFISSTISFFPLLLFISSLVIRSLGQQLLFWVIFYFFINFQFFDIFCSFCSSVCLSVTLTFFLSLSLSPPHPHPILSPSYGSQPSYSTPSPGRVFDWKLRLLWIWFDCISHSEFYSNPERCNKQISWQFIRWIFLVINFFWIFWPDPGSFCPLKEVYHSLVQQESLWLITSHK